MQVDMSFSVNEDHQRIPILRAGDGAVYNVTGIMEPTPAAFQ
jgi:hypothetical protein